MSDATPPEGQPSEHPAPPPGFAGSTPPSGDIAPSGFADYSSYEPPNVIAPAPPPRPDAPATNSRSRGPLPVIIAVIVIAVLAVGAFVLFAGGSDDETSGGTPGAAVLAWAGRMADQDYAGACELLSTRSIEQIDADGSSCPEALAALDPDGVYAEGDRAEVGRTSLDGNEAQVTLDGGGAALDGRVVAAVKIDGTWKASPFEDGAGGDGTQTEPTASPDPRDDTGAAATAACGATIATTESAAEAYAALNGRPPASVQDLVDAGLLREVPQDVEITASGEAAGTGPCA